MNKEERLANLEKVFNSLSDGISIHSVDGDIIDANEALCELLGAPLEEILGKKCYQLFHYREEPIRDCPMKKSVQSKKSESTEIFVDGLGRWLLFSAYPILGKDGEVGKVAHVVRDITEHKGMEKAYEEVKMLDKMKDELISNVSHELRTPLTVANTALEIASEDETDEKKKQLLERGRKNLIHLNRLIGDLMEATKLKEKAVSTQEIVHTGKAAHGISTVEVLTRKPVGIAEIIKSCMDEFAAEAGERKITVESQVDGEPRVLGDAEELKMIFSALLSNAIKFNKEGGRVSVNAGAKGDKIAVSISDTGVGMPEEEFSKIFDKFYQIDGSTTRQFEGTGLGLFLAKGIVEKYGGRIWVESEVGKGSKFIFTLPGLEG